MINAFPSKLGNWRKENIIIDISEWIKDFRIKGYVLLKAHLKLYAAFTVKVVKEIMAE